MGKTGPHAEARLDWHCGFSEIPRRCSPAQCKRVHNVSHLTPAFPAFWMEDTTL